MTSDAIKIKTRQEPVLMKARTLEVFNRVVVPADQAQIGDLVGVCLSLMRSVSEASPYTLTYTYFYLLGENGISPRTYEDLRKSNHPRLAEFADLGMVVLGDQTPAVAANDAMCEMDKSDGDFHLDAILFQGGMILTYDDAESAADIRCDDGILNQKDAPDIIQLITPTIKSEHERIETIARTQPFLDLLSELLQFEDEDEQVIPLTTDLC